jgi:hypothetical protein
LDLSSALGTSGAWVKKDEADVTFCETITWTDRYKLQSVWANAPGANRVVFNRVNLNASSGIHFTEKHYFQGSYLFLFLPMLTIRYS